MSEEIKSGHVADDHLHVPDSVMWTNPNDPLVRHLRAKILQAKEPEHFDYIRQRMEELEHSHGELHAEIGRCHGPCVAAEQARLRETRRAEEARLAAEAEAALLVDESSLMGELSKAETAPAPEAEPELESVVEDEPS